jgi:hypothetical protein
MKPKSNYSIKVACYLLIYLIVFSCSSTDDVDIDPSLLLDSYVQPYLNFLVDEETFVADNGPADERGVFIDGIFLAYNRDLKGVIEYFYVFRPSSSNPDFVRYIQLNVRVEPNQRNLNMILNSMTNLYGEPDFFQDLSSTTDTNIFPPTATFDPSLSFTRNNFDDDSPFLIAGYTRNN